ncbi:hypothetical protein PoB_001566600 [Plakobranchus ocellatus]|uniref:Uncharacterized protein n=1 Tax=Plakobranchus ocellatus TaxID=259542 RepID=A0AAV3Z026_9GAST|nr:hypothetical protein PoB_001566600 [Plakobranchus ocellatus]
MPVYSMAYSVIHGGYSQNPSRPVLARAITVRYKLLFFFNCCCVRQREASTRVPWKSAQRDPASPISELTGFFVSETQSVFLWQVQATNDPRNAEADDRVALEDKIPCCGQKDRSHLLTGGKTHYCYQYG